MDLIATKRTAFGHAVKALRKQGFIPVELYGHGIANEHLTVSAKEFGHVFRQAGESSVITLVLGEEKRPVLVYEVARHPVTDDIAAVDFYQVRLDEKIRVKAPLAFEGLAPAVKEKGGVLVKAAHDLEIEALPANIPHAIPVSLQVLSDIGQSIYVRDLVVPEGVRVVVDPGTVIVSVVEKLSEKKEEELAAQVDVGTIKAEAEEKKAEREATLKTQGAVEASPSADQPKK